MPGSIFEQLVDQSRTQGFSFSHPWSERGVGRRKTLRTRLLLGDFCVYLFYYYFLTGIKKQ